MKCCGFQIHPSSRCGEVCYNGKIDFCSDCEKINLFNDGYSKALNDLGVEVFKIIDWGENHGNGQLISRQQVKNIIETLRTGSGNNSQEEKARIRKEDSTKLISDPMTPENSLAINGVGTPDKHSPKTNKEKKDAI